MCGSARSTTSPSISRMRRSTPCAAGCCGPKLIVKLCIWMSGMGSPAPVGPAPALAGRLLNVRARARLRGASTGTGAPRRPCPGSAVPGDEPKAAVAPRGAVSAVALGAAGR